MTEHQGKASLTLVKSGIWLPSIQDAFATLIEGQQRGAWAEAETKHRFAGAAVKALAPVLGLLGVGVHERDRADLFRELLRGKYFVAGGAALGDYAEQEIMEHFFKNTAIFASPASLDVHLYTAATSDANSSGTEVSGGSYAAKNVAAAGWDAPGATGGATANSADVDFGTATANWGTISHVSIEVVATANRLFHGALTASKTVNSGDSFRFATGALQCSIS